MKAIYNYCKNTASATFEVVAVTSVASSLKYIIENLEMTLCIPVVRPTEETDLLSRTERNTQRE